MNYTLYTCENNLMNTMPASSGRTLATEILYGINSINKWHGHRLQ